MKFVTREVFGPPFSFYNTYSSKTKMVKTEFICVKPKSSKAKNRFANQMRGLHSCRVEQRKDGKVFLASVSGHYFFWLSEGGDDHWEILDK